MDIEINLFAFSTWVGIDWQERGREKTRARHFLSIGHYNWLAYANSYKSTSKQGYQSHSIDEETEAQNKEMTQKSTKKSLGK